MKIPHGPEFTTNASAPSEQPATLTLNGKFYEYNLASVLAFSNDLEEATATHAQNQSFWEQTALSCASMVHEFEEIGLAKWNAHSRRYTHLVMHSLNVRETLESSKDWMITVFTEDLSLTDRDIYSRAAFRGSLVQRLGAGKVDAYLAKNEFPDELETFAQGMYSYWDAQWTYEKIVKTHRSMKEQRDKLQAFAKTMNERSFQIKQYKDMVMAKHGNVNPFQQDAMGRSKESQSPGKINSVTEGKVIASNTENPKKTRQFNMPKTAQ